MFFPPDWSYSIGKDLRSMRVIVPGRYQPCAAWQRLTPSSAADKLNKLLGIRLDYDVRLPCCEVLRECGANYNFSLVDDSDLKRLIVSVVESGRVIVLVKRALGKFYPVPTKGRGRYSQWWLATKEYFQSTGNPVSMNVKEAHDHFKEWFGAANDENYDSKEDWTESGPRLVSLCEHLAYEDNPAFPSFWDIHEIPAQELYRRVGEAIKKGDVVVFEKLKTLEQFNPQAKSKGTYSYEEYEKLVKPYAQHYGIDLGKKKAKKDLEKDKITPPMTMNAEAKSVYKGSGNPEPLPDKVSDVCPHKNYRSESTDTASEEVKKWFNNEKNLADHGNSTLGRKGGGGFLVGSTRVVKFSKGTTFYHYCTPEGEKGCWQFFRPLKGDPRVFAALPKDSAGTYMVESVFPEDTEALVGIGAPRCSNKPGGPIQICLKFELKNKLNLI